MVLERAADSGCDCVAEVLDCASLDIVRPPGRGHDSSRVVQAGSSSPDYLNSSAHHDVRRQVQDRSPRKHYYLVGRRQHDCGDDGEHLRWWGSPYWTTLWFD